MSAEAPEDSPARYFSSYIARFLMDEDDRTDRRPARNGYHREPREGLPVRDGLGSLGLVRPGDQP